MWWTSNSAFNSVKVLREVSSLLLVVLNVLVVLLPVSGGCWEGRLACSRCRSSLWRSLPFNPGVLVVMPSCLRALRIATAEVRSAIFLTAENFFFEWLRTKACPLFADVAGTFL
jgi:hypothetical protein